MKKRLIIGLLMACLPLMLLAQIPGGEVSRPVKKTKTETTKPSKPAKPAKKQNASLAKPTVQKPIEQKPAEAAGYDVTIRCNVPTATLYIDGTANGTASGSRFLKTGSHQVRLQAEGYESHAQSITVSSQSTSFSFVLKKEENKLSPVLQHLVANMVYVEGGSFTMGATSEQLRGAAYDEKPVHQVTVSSFSIGKYEVTQEEWEAVMGCNPSKFKGAKRPVENVSWYDCNQFIRQLNAMTGKRFRLPTEAEWEFAARGGRKSIGHKYAGGDKAGGDNLDRVAWYDGNSGNATHDVGQKSPNELGLYDMSGNVYEWCQDWYGGYSRGSQLNPSGPSSGSSRVARGGGWDSYARCCRVSFRFFNTPDCRGDYLGLRLAL